MTATIINIGTLIVSSPDICGNRPRIAGTGVSVGRIATLWKSGMGAEEIARDIQLNLAQVFAALTYYHANRAEIENILDRDDAEYERLMELHYAQQVFN
jgi:uncharacterized protein (DUF433 family)